MGKIKLQQVMRTNRKGKPKAPSKEDTAAKVDPSVNHKVVMYEIGCAETIAVFVYV